MAESDKSKNRVSDATVPDQYDAGRLEPDPVELERSIEGLRTAYGDRAAEQAMKLRLRLPFSLFAQRVWERLSGS